MIEYITDHWVSHYNYWAAIVIMMIGLYTVISHTNLIRKIAGLNVFQTAVFLLYVSMGVVAGGTAPIAAEAFSVYSNPLPQVLMLTAIVVGVATTALAFAIVVRIREAYESIEENELNRLDIQQSGDDEEW